MNAIMTSSTPEKHQLRQILSDFTFSDFKGCLESWLTTGRINWMIYGNIDKQIAT